MGCDGDRNRRGTEGGHGSGGDLRGRKEVGGA